MEVNPITSLSVFVLILILGLIFFYPKKGILARYIKLKISTKKNQLEDALKHIFDYEYHNLKPTLNSIAGNLEISTDKASIIISKLKKSNLIVINNLVISLTEEGKIYALRIIRVHRLWENYLAEEIGMDELEWHDQAEMIEHSLTPEEADALSAKMGNPKFDPHGDPIPSTDGVLPIKKSVSLNEAEAGQTLQITHIEDEPKSIYTKLVKEKLFPGRVVKVLLKTPKKIKLSADGDEINITPLLASNVNVKQVAKSEFIDEKQRDLLSLKKGEVGVVARILPVCRGQQRRRLLDFGIVPGSEISVLMKSPMNDPVAYIVKDTIVALRKDQAKQVILKNVS